MEASDRRKTFCSTMDLIIPHEQTLPFKVNDTVRNLPHRFLRFVYTLKQSLVNLPTTDNNASNFAEEWRFHQLSECSFSSKEKIRKLETTTKGSHLRSRTMHSLTPRRDGLIDKPQA